MKKHITVFLATLAFTLLSSLSYSQLLYGGGSSDKYGNIITITPSGQYSVAASFNSTNGSGTPIGLTLATDGNLYGITQSGGSNNNGELFKLDESGKITALHYFNDSSGVSPVCRPMQASDGKLYGTTISGGKYGHGVIFSYDYTTNTYTDVFDFPLSSGGSTSTLLQATDGNLYGTNSGGIYRYTISGTCTRICNINGLLCRNLIQGYDGYLYGLYGTGGGPYGTGSDDMIFRCSLSGKDTIIGQIVDVNSVTFSQYGLIQGKDSNLYGLSTNQLFKCNLSGNITSLYTFGVSYAVGPTGGLLQATDGNLYGTTQLGGTYSHGTIFKCSTAGNFTTIHNNNLNESPSPEGNVFIELNPVTLNGTDSIKGIAYIDNNNNCIYDAGDTPLQGITMNLIYNYGQILTSTISNSNGVYVFNNVHKGINYYVAPDSATYSAYKLTCPNTLPQKDSAGTLSANFGFNCNITGTLSGNLNICAGQPNANSFSVSTCLASSLCQHTKGYITLVVDTSMLKINKIVSDSIPVTNGDTLTFYFKDMSASTLQDLCVNLYGTNTIPAGDSIPISLIYNTMPADTTLSHTVTTEWLKNNSCTDAAYKPNNKYVTPTGLITTGQTLTYTIQFQNTTSSVANTVTIIDTLDGNLDVTSLKILSSSYPASVQILNNNILVLTFNNINLPDSAVSQAQSKGYIAYSILPGGIPYEYHLFTIYNTAYVYFDKSPAQITNTVSSKVMGTLGIQPVNTNEINMVCFPNPFNSNTTLFFNKAGKYYIELDDVAGRKEKWLEISGNRYVLSRGNLATGVYLLKVYNESMEYISCNKLIIE